MTSLHLDALVWDSPARFHVELTVASGEVVPVLTTETAVGTRLADVVVGIAAPVRGAVRLDDHDVTERPPRHRGIALVPPDGALLPHLDVERNIAYGRGGAAPRYPRAVRHWAERFGLDGIRDLRPHELSAAQRLRVALARGFCHDAPAAIVIEDRGGRDSCRAGAAIAAAHDAAVIVITESADLGTAFMRRPVEPTPVEEPDAP